MLENLSNITTAITLNRCLESLTEQYQRKKWIGITANPSAHELVICALGRIQLNPSQFDVFIDMLRGTGVMDDIVEMLTGEFRQHIFHACQNITANIEYYADIIWHRCSKLITAKLASF